MKIVITQKIYRGGMNIVFEIINNEGQIDSKVEIEPSKLERYGLVSLICGGEQQKVELHCINRLAK